MEAFQTAKIVGWVMASFALLKGLSTFCAFIAEKTKTDWDNKWLARPLCWLVGLMGKFIDQFIGNTRAT